MHLARIGKLHLKISFEAGADITISDAKWIGSQLTGLSDEQIKDAFRASNYPPEEVDRLSVALRQRIAALINVSSHVASRP